MTTTGEAADTGQDAPAAGAARFAQAFESLVDSAAIAIHGKRDVIAAALTCLLAEGHLLIEDVPGVGKTSLAKALARAMQLGFARIQFTPDLLPSDVVGSTVWHSASSEVQFHPGPVFTNVLLGDELNRASPKTQSALLEAMEEHQVTADGATRRLPDPFMVVATQNPVEHHGTFPLPESQLDRFLMRLSVGYPAGEHEVALLTEEDHSHSLDRVLPVMDATTVSAMVTAAERVHVSDAVARYVVDLANLSRRDPDVMLGVSPRACLGWLRAARVRAAASGRTFVTPDDLKTLAEPVLAHRMVLSSAALSRGGDSSTYVSELLTRVAVPA